MLGVAPQLMGWSQQLHRSMAAVEREVEGLLQWGEEEEEGEPDTAGALATLWRSVQDIGAVDAACQVSKVFASARTPARRHAGAHSPAWQASENGSSPGVTTTFRFRIYNIM